MASSLCPLSHQCIVLVAFGKFGKFPVWLELLLPELVHVLFLQQLPVLADSVRLFSCASFPTPLVTFSPELPCIFGGLRMHCAAGHQSQVC